MKLVTFAQPGQPQQIGVLVNQDQTIAVLQAAARARTGLPNAYFSDMLAFLSGGRQARDEAHEVLEFILTQQPPNVFVNVSEVRLLSPVPRPESIRDCMAFEQHIINATRTVGLKKFAKVDEWLERLLGRKRSLAYNVNKAWYERPLYYKSNRFSVIGPEAQVIIPPYTRQFDYELEWGIFICNMGRDFSPRQAQHFIGGYTIFNDFSARDIQMREMRGRLGPAKGKDFDTGNAIGPCLVTPDEVPDPYNLAMYARINGEQWSACNTRNMSWPFEEILSYISRSETLYPGEFIGSGTCSGPEGRGCGLELGRYLKPGDRVELEVDGIGVLRNQVVSAEQIAQQFARG